MNTKGLKGSRIGQIGLEGAWRMRKKVPECSWKNTQPEWSGKVQKYLKECKMLQKEGLEWSDRIKRARKVQKDFIRRFQDGVEGPWRDKKEVWQFQHDLEELDKPIRMSQIALEGSIRSRKGPEDFSFVL